MTRIMMFVTFLEICPKSKVSAEDRTASSAYFQIRSHRSRFWVGWFCHSFFFAFVLALFAISLFFFRASIDRKCTKHYILFGSVNRPWYHWKPCLKPAHPVHIYLWLGPMRAVVTGSALNTTYSLAVLTNSDIMESHVSSQHTRVHMEPPDFLKH